MKESGILFEYGRFWVLDNGKCFEVYKQGITNSVRVASVGYGPAPTLGIERAKSECKRRQEGEL